MTTSLQFLSLVVACAFAVTLGSSTALAQMTARIVRINGDARQATVTNPSAAPAVAALNLAIVEGASIETRAGVELFVETFPGAIATIRENSLVRLNSLRLVSAGADAGKRAAELELQRGNVVSTLDASKQAITKYGIKTPRGVAAARGTVYGVSVIPAAAGGSGSSVLVLSGFIVIERGPGEAPISIPFGQAALDNADQASALAALAAASPAVAADILAAVQVVASNVAAATSAAGSADEATKLLASVASAAVSALPGQASAIVQMLVGAIVAPGSAVGGNQQAILKAVSAVTDAAVRAVIASGGGVTQVGTAAGAAAHGIVQAKVNEALTAGKLANPPLTQAQMIQAANQAAGSDLVTSSLSVIGNVAGSAAVRMLGQSGDAGAAASTGATVAQAATAGASSGALAALAGSGISAPGGGFSPPGVKVTVTTNSSLGKTTVASTAASSTSTSTWSGSSEGPVTTETVSPAGPATTVVPPFAAGKKNSPAPASFDATAPQPKVTPMLPINPTLNVSPSGG